MRRLIRTDSQIATPHRDHWPTIEFVSPTHTSKIFLLLNLDQTASMMCNYHHWLFLCKQKLTHEIICGASAPGNAGAARACTTSVGTRSTGSFERSLPSRSAQRSL